MEKHSAKTVWGEKTLAVGSEAEQLRLRAAEEFHKELREVLEPFVGKINTDDTRRQVEATLKSKVPEGAKVRVVKRIEESTKNKKPTLVFMDEEGILEEKEFRSRRHLREHLKYLGNSAWAYILA